MKNITNAILDDFISRSLTVMRAERPRATFLEIGCGDLRYREHIDEDAWTCVFTDVEFRSSEVSVLADVQRLPFADHSFDIIMMTEVLEHIPDIDRALLEISRILSPGGVLIVTFPFNYGLHELPNDYRRWTEFNAITQFAKVGLITRTFERRGDALAVLLTIIAQLTLGAVEVLRMKPLFRPVYFVLQPIASGAIGLLSLCYLSLWCRPTMRRSLSVAGEGLKGARGHLGLWHLGYQFICQKEA